MEGARQHEGVAAEGHEDRVHESPKPVEWRVRGTAAEHTAMSVDLEMSAESLARLPEVHTGEQHHNHRGRNARTAKACASRPEAEDWKKLNGTNDDPTVQSSRLTVRTQHQASIKPGMRGCNPGDGRDGGRGEGGRGGEGRPADGEQAQGDEGVVHQEDSNVDQQHPLLVGVLVALTWRARRRERGREVIVMV